MWSLSTTLSSWWISSGTRVTAPLHKASSWCPLFYTRAKRRRSLTFSWFCLVTPRSCFVKRFKSKQAWNPPYSFILHQSSNNYWTFKMQKGFRFFTIYTRNFYFLTVGPHSLKKKQRKREKKKGNKGSKSFVSLLEDSQSYFFCNFTHLLLTVHYRVVLTDF